MKRIYKEGLIGIGGLLILLLLIIIYHLRYPIDANNDNLREITMKFLNNKANVERIIIHDTVSVNSRRYVLIEVDDYLGQIDLIKGICGGYGIESIGYGTNKFRYRVEKNNKRKYIIFGGENKNLLIAKIKFTLESQEYSIDVPSSEYFLTCLEVDSKTQSDYPEAKTIRFYNANGDDITDQVEI